MKSISFGVGSLQFTAYDKIPFSFNGKKYLEQLHEYLSNIPNVSNIVTGGSSQFLNKIIPIKKQTTDIKSSMFFLPPPASEIEIRFDIYIPSRISKEYPRPMFRPVTKAERFRVYMPYSYFFPVAIVELLDVEDDECPSDGVYVIKKFLEDHSENIKASNIKFETLGPTPFHADFKLIEVKSLGEENSPDFGCQITSQRGFDKVDFTYNSSAHDNLNSAKEKIYSRIADELGMYYSKIQRNHISMSKWQDIMSQLENFLSRQTSKSLKTVVTKWFLDYKDIRELTTEISKFEIDFTLAEYFVVQDFQAIIHSDKKPYLQKFIDEAVNDRISFPTQQTRELITFNEARRANNFEGVIVVLSAIIGGIVGAVITLLLSN